MDAWCTAPLHTLVLVEGLGFAKKVFPGTKVIVPGAFAFHMELTTLLHMYSLYSMLSRILEQSFRLNFSSLGFYRGVEEGRRSDIYTSLYECTFTWKFLLVFVGSESASQQSVRRKK